jgi:hypothetical protein
MRKAWMMVAMLLCVASFASPARADEKSYRAAILEYFKLADMDGMMQHSMDLMLAAQVQANPALGRLMPKMKEFFMKYMSWKSLEEEFIGIYEKAFTEAEFKKLLAFYKTPVGIKCLKQMPKLMEQGAQIGNQRLQQHMAELQQMIMDAAKTSH